MKMIDQVASIIRDFQDFFIMTHVNPDGDAIGSLLGMYLALKENGKIAIPVIGAEFPDLFNFLPGSGNTVIGFDSIGFSPSHIIALDVAAENRISPEIGDLRKSAKLVNVDHHPTNPRYGDYNYVLPSANSTTQLVYEILKRAGYRVSPDVAKCLYTGLVTDTGCFKFAGVTSATFELAARLLELGVDNYEITRKLFEEFPESRLSLERLMIERLEVLLNGKLVLSYIDFEDYQKLGASMSEGESLVNRLRETRGVEVGGLITKLSENLYKVSLRSKGFVNVATVASALGGGGHSRAAGLKVSMSREEIRERLIKLIDASLNSSAT